MDILSTLIEKMESKTTQPTVVVLSAQDYSRIRVLAEKYSLLIPQPKSAPQLMGVPLVVAEVKQSYFITEAHDGPRVHVL